MDNFDVLIVGCGLSGAAAARMLADNGYKVKILDRRSHIGGNMYDYTDEFGILVHKYGPHTFHTKSKELFDFICRYADWEDYHLRCGAVVNGICTPTPFNYQTIDDFYPPAKADDLKQRIEKAFPNRKTATVLEALACEDEAVREYAQFLFDNDYSLYTAKQWGVPADKIDLSVLNRVPLRFSYESDYFDDPYQVMPKKSFTDFFVSLLNHKNISVALQTDALAHLAVREGRMYLDGELWDKPVVYTGALDELFDLQYGALPYRSLSFYWVHEDINSKQDMAVVAYPQEVGFTRIVEFKKMFPKRTVSETTYEMEYPIPYKKGIRQEPYYPVLTEESKAQYKKYRDLADKIPNLYCCGRLADFQYYNMDQALEKALKVSCNLLLKEHIST